MKDKLINLNEHLFTAIERLSSEELDSDGIDREIKRCKGIVNIGQTIISNARLALDVKQYVDEMNPGAAPQTLPAMLESAPRRLDA